MNDAFKSATISGGKLLEKIVSFSIILMASRHFGSEGIGEFFYYFSTVSLFIPLMDFGFEKLLMRRWWDKNETEKKQMLGNIIILKMISGSTSLLFAITVDFCVRGPESKWQAIVGAFLAIYFDEAGGLFRTPKRVKNIFTLDIISPLISRICTLVLFLITFGEIASGHQFVFIYAASNAVGLLISITGLKGYSPVFNTVSKPRLIELAKAGLPFSMTSLCVMISLYVDSVMLGYFSISEVGLYNSAYRIILVVAALSGGTCHVLFPKFIKLKAEGHMAKASHMFFGVLRIHFIIFGSIAVGGLLFGAQMMPAIYGDDFSDAGLPFVILSLLVVTVSFTNVIGHTLEAFGMEKVVMSITMKAALFNFVSNLIFIPVWGMVGAACTTVLTEMVTLIVQFRTLKKYDVMPWKPKELIRGYLFVIILIPIYLLIPPLNIWLSIALGAVAFLTLFFVGKNYWLNGIQIKPEAPK